LSSILLGRWSEILGIFCVTEFESNLLVGNFSFGFPKNVFYSRPVMCDVFLVTPVHNPVFFDKFHKM